MTDTPYAWMGIVTKYTNSSGSQSTVGRIKKVPAPTYTAEDIDVTDQDSAGVKQFISGLKEGSEVEFIMNDSPNDAGQIALIADEGKSGTMEHTFPSGRSISYPITIKTVNIIEDGKAGALSVKGKVSGTITKATAPVNLTALAVGVGATLTPAFSATVYDYIAAYAAGTTSTTVTATNGTAGVTLTVDGAAATTATPVTIGSLTNGTIHVAEIKVSQTAKTSMVYKVRISVAPS
jgi:hypothetical protein